MSKLSTILIFGMSLLLASCGTKNISTPETPTIPPTERIAPSPTLAPPMDTSTPPPTTAPVMETSTQAPTFDSADADVTYVRAIQDAEGSWTFHITVSHPDTGWDDYANGWDILLPNGSKLKVQEGDAFTRLLAHPHVDEQPFTRSKRGIIIPENMTRVIVRAHDIVDGFGGQEIIVDLEKDSGKGFEVERE
ncbi:MAG: hypothetical protein HOD49_11200 [Anaerolineae bacterium]|nr:hypothetical protein [Anaerolineae bacterium]